MLYLALIDSYDTKYSCIFTHPLWFQVEVELFPDMKDKKLFLRGVYVDESLVQDYMNQAVDVFKLNTVGPQKYVSFTVLATVLAHCTCTCTLYLQTVLATVSFQWQQSTK